MAIFSAIGFAVAGALFTAGTAAYAITASVVGAVAAFGAQLAFSYINRPKARAYSAVQGELQYGGDVPVGAIFGTGKVRGQLAKYAKWGSGNQFNAEALILSNGWCDGLEPYVYFYGEKHNLIAQTAEGAEHARYFVEGFGSNLVIRFYDGRPGQQADGQLVAETADSGAPWESTATLAGMCYVVVRRKYDADLFEKGAPDIEFVLRGLRCYDWRKDSTVAGGSGTHRINDSATWEFTENPAVQRFNYQLGFRGAISNRVLIGEGKSIGQMDLESYTHAANVCDEQRTVAGRTFSRYQCALYVTGEDDHTEILQEFDDAMAGYALNRRGLSGIIVGAPQIPVATLAENDIRSEVGKTIQLRKSAFELYNHMAGQFTSKESQFAPESLTPIVVNADVAADGRFRQATNDFLQVTDPDVAQYLLQIRYRQQRLGGTVEIPVTRFFGFQVVEGEWITWRDRDWLIVEWRIDEDAQISIVLEEVDASIYDDETIDPGPIINPTPPTVNPALLPNVQNFAVEVGVVAGADGQQMPCLRFTWSPPDDPSITEVRFQYGSGTFAPTDPFEDVSKFPESGEYITTKNVEGGNFYTARCTITTVPDRFKTFSSWISTPDVTEVRYSSILDGSVTADKIADAAVGANALMNDAVTSLKLADDAVTAAKMAVNAVTQEAIAAGAIVASKLADLAVTQAKIAAGAVNLTKIASGMTLVENFTTQLPTTGNFEGRTGTFNGKLYRYTGGAWSASVAAVDITGTVPIADGSVTAAKIANAAVGASKLASGAVTHDKLSAGSIYGDVIAAGSITARELVLTDWNNLVPDNYVMSTWRVSGGSNKWMHGLNGSTSWNTPYYWRYQYVAGGSSYDGDFLYTPDFPVEQGKEYWFSYQSHVYSGTKGEVWARVHWYDSAGVALTGADQFSSIASDAITALVQTKTNSVVAPNGASTGQIRWYVNSDETDADIGIGGVIVHRRSGAELIVDGAITADKISAAEAITVGGIRLDTMLGYSTADGFRFGFEPDEMVLVPPQTGNVLTPVMAQQYAGTQSLQINCSNANVTDSGFGLDTNRKTVIAAIPADAVSTFFGKRVKVTIFAKQTAANPSAQFALSFATGSSGGNSGWKYFTPTANWAAYSFYYDVGIPSMVTQGGGLVIWADTSGTGKGLLVDSLSVSVTSEDMARDPATQINANVTTINGGKISTGTVAALQIAASAITSEKIAADAITAAKIAAGAITASELAAGAVLTEKLAVGLGKNTLYNASFTMGLDGWWYNSYAGNVVTFELRPVDQSFSGVSSPTLMIYQNTASEGYTDVHNAPPGRAGPGTLFLSSMVVQPGDIVEASAYTSAHRCTVELRIRWLDAAGNTLTYAGTDYNSAIQGANQFPDGWPRLVVRGTAPAGAVAAGIHVRKLATNAGETTSYLFLHKPMLAKTHAGATEAMPWSDGSVTMIDAGGIVTDAVRANHILANAITADKIATNAITAGKIATNAIVAGNIQSSAVTADKIAASAVTADKIAAASVTADKMVANSITARELVLTDFENFVPNGSFINGTLDGWTSVPPEWFVARETGSGALDTRPTEYVLAMPVLAGTVLATAATNIPSQPGDKLLIACKWARGGGVGNISFRLRVRYMDRNGATLSTYGEINVSGSGQAWTQEQAVVTVPAGTAGISRVEVFNIGSSGGFSGTLYMTDIVVKKQKGANLIVDGAITADKLAVTTLSAISGNVGTLTAGLIRSSDNKVQFNLTTGLLTMDD